MVDKHLKVPASADVQVITAEHLAAVEEIVSNLRKIPDQARNWTISLDQAIKRQRIPIQILDLLTSNGLGRSQGQDIWFDVEDLRNLTLELGLKCVWTLALRYWGEVLDRAALGTSTSSTVGVIPHCSGQSLPHTCQITYMSPMGWSVPTANANSVVETIHFSGKVNWPSLPTSICELIDDFKYIHFMRLPKSLSDDIEFINRTGFADCGGAAQMLLAEGTRRGLPLRRAKGLLLSRPFSTVHNWVETLVDDIWVPIDPFFLQAMLRWQLISSETWDPLMSPGSGLAFFTEKPGPLARDRGEWASVSYPTGQVHAR